MKLGSVVTYENFEEGWIGVIISFGDCFIDEYYDCCVTCCVRWYDGSVTEELIEMLKVIK